MSNITLHNFTRRVPCGVSLSHVHLPWANSSVAMALPGAVVTKDNYMSKIEYLIWQYDTSLHLVTSVLVRNGSWGITLTSLTTSLAIMKYMSRPYSAADILGQKYQYRIDIVHGDIDPSLPCTLPLPLIKIKTCCLKQLSCRSNALFKGMPIGTT